LHDSSYNLRPAGNWSLDRRQVATLIADSPRLSGLYHLASTTISKHELLCQLRDAYQLDVDIIPEDETVCDRKPVRGALYARHGPPHPTLARAHRRPGGWPYTV
jgi:hypothetical protein